MQVFAAEGLILKRKNYSEADKLITLFTKSQGKIVTLAKGIRKITSRRSSNLELLNHVKIYLHQSKGLPIVTESQAVQAFPNLKEDLDKLSIAFVVLELVDKLFAEGQENKLVFELLLDTLERIDQSKSLTEANKFQASFQIKLLSQVGYLPQLYSCVNCEKELKEERNWLSPNSGGLVDYNCNQETFLSRPIGPEAIKILRFLNQKPFVEILRLNLDRNLLFETADLLNYYTTFFLEKDLNSHAFAREVNLLN